MPSRWFRIAYAENAFRRVLADQGTPVAAVRAPDALRAWLEFYRGHRAQHARVTDEGDALLWQWGPDADAERFTVDFTRQLVRDGDDQPIVQVCLTLAYRWTPARRALGRGHAWCFAPASSRDFERDVRASTAYRAIAGAVPAAVLLRTESL